MRELELTRSRDDRRLYVLDSIGTLRLQGWLARTALAEADGRSWTLARRGVLRTSVEAADAAGSVVGAFHGRSLRRGGPLTWEGRELELRPASAWRERYALAAGEQELAQLEGKGWGRRPVKVRLERPDAVAPGLLLFATYVVRALAEDAGAAAGGTVAATSAATAGS